LADNSLTVLSVAFPFCPVGEDAAGGAEQVLSILDRALTKRGHQSLVVAAEGSVTAGTLIATRAPAYAPLIRDTLYRYSVDIIHMHCLEFHEYLPDEDVPVLATLHLPVSFYPESIFNLPRLRTYLNCVSESQRKTCPGSAELIQTIANGIEVSRFEMSYPKESYALSLGRICPEKGFHHAIIAAKQANVDLIIAGKVFNYAWHQEYFTNEIEPRLDERRRFIGPVGFGCKKALLSRAKCLLIPSTVSETSSLVAMEALACGTPVVAFRSGALPEIIEHGQTGYLVSDAYEMGQAMGCVTKIKPENCREAARTHFNSERMVAAYLDAYERLR